MAELLRRLGRRLIFSRRQRCVRRGVVFLFTNALAVAGFVFAVELLLILLGLENVFLPLTRDTLSYLTQLFL